MHKSFSVCLARASQGDDMASAGFAAAHVLSEIPVLFLETGYPKVDPALQRLGHSTCGLQN